MEYKKSKQLLIYILQISILLFFSFFPESLQKTVLAKYDIYFNLLIACFIFFYIIRHKKTYIWHILIILFLTFQLFSTVSHQGHIAWALWGRGVLIISLCIGIQSTYYYNEKLFLKTVYLFFYSLIFINFITLLLFPNGMYEDIRGITDTNYFLGNYNGFIIYIFPALITGYLYFKKYTNKLPPGYLFLWVISLLTFIIKRSATSLIGLSIFGIYILFFNTQKSHLFFNIKSYLAANIAFFYFFVWNSSNNQILNLVTSLIGKDITFTGRTLIWKNAKYHIYDCWLIGNGLEKAETITNKLGFIQATSAHNLMLDLLYKTGFLGFIILSIPFFIFLNNLKKINNIKIRYSLEAFCGILLLMSQFEAYNLKFILFIFTILYMYTCENRKSKAGKFD